MSGMTHHWAQVNDLSMHYVTAGPADGPVTVLLHGYPQTWYCWRETIEHLVAAGRRCIAPDLRGLGDTTRPADGFDKRTIAGDVHELLAQLGIGDYDLVGHDWGGAVAFALAAHYDSRVRRMAIVDVAIPGDGQANIGQGGRRWHHTFLKTLDLPEALIEGREEIWLRWFYDNYGHRPGVITEDAVREYLRTYAAPGALRAGFAWYRAIEQDVRDNTGLPKLEIPVLAIGGGNGFGRAEEVGNSVRQMASNVEAVVFDECGHWVPEERPDQLSDVLLHFFS
jgi:pimeloyl-ACP methyl ester carboxylesterase